MVAILIAGTSLFSNSGDIPWWWFHFSFLVLISLTFIVPITIFYKPIYKRYTEYSRKNKRNIISQHYFSEFKDLLQSSKRFSSPIRDVMNALRARYQKSIESSLTNYILQSHNESTINNTFHYIDKSLDESNKSYRDLYLIMKQLESIINIYKRNLKIIEQFIHEISVYKGKPIPKDIEGTFEDFREEYNAFLRDITQFCRKINQETGESEFPEYAFQHINKWIWF